MYPECVLFDLDGTLADSVPDMANAVDAALVKTGSQPVGQSVVRGWVGDGVGMLVERALKNAHGDDVTESQTRAAMDVFLEHYERNVCVDSVLYPGIFDLLTTLHAEGVPLGVVTNKPEAFTNPLLEALGIHTRFGSIIGGDTLETRKPDGLPVTTACRELGANPSASVLVGDSPNDALAARAAGSGALLMTWGYNVGVDLKTLDADGLFDSAGSLLKALSDWRNSD